MHTRRLVLLAASVASAPVMGCSGVAQQRIGVHAPPEDQFLPVADYLDHRCGTLDCHGQTGRNLRMWGCDGMRLKPTDISGCVFGPPTTSAEYEATYRSLVGLEPAVMSAVVDGHAVRPDLLTFVRKAIGTEAHKGGQLIAQGDDQEKCIVSWLAGSTDTTACGKALNYPMFPQPGGGGQGPMDASIE
jgi:hypothetical protein